MLALYLVVPFDRRIVILINSTSKLVSRGATLRACVRACARVCVCVTLSPKSSRLRRKSIRENTLRQIYAAVKNADNRERAIYFHGGIFIFLYNRDCATSARQVRGDKSLAGNILGSTPRYTPCVCAPSSRRPGSNYPLMGTPVEARSSFSTGVEDRPRGYVNRVCARDTKETCPRVEQDDGSLRGYAKADRRPCTSSPSLSPSR